MSGFARWHLGASEQVITCNRLLLKKSHPLVGVTKVRNEALILQDTLDHVGAFADAIIAYDDANTDETFDILKSHPKVALIIENKTWVGGSKARLDAETRHRGLLLDLARKHMRSNWIYCFDADERIIGEQRTFLGNVAKSDCKGVRVRLFDAYLTPDDQAPVKPESTAAASLNRKSGTS